MTTAHPRPEPDRSPRRPAPPLGREPILVPSADVLVRYNARVLDPASAVRRRPDEVIRPTVYVGNRLLVRGLAPGSVRYDVLARAAKDHNLGLSYADADGAAEAARASTLGEAYPARMVLTPLTSPAAPADAWPVLQSYRTLVGDEQVPQDVALEHLLTATTGPGIGGLPASEGHGVGGLPASEGHGVGPATQYGMPGWGGRTPVNWIGPKPVRNPTSAERRPVVAVLDTGVGSHPWLDDAATIVRNPTIDGTPGGPPLGLTDPLTDPERTGVLVDPYEGILDSDAGHGTFIAGIIRQLCPEATVLAVRIMSGDGVVAEGDLLDALAGLLARQYLALSTGRPELAVDVVSLSLGYYHEQPDDAAFDPMLLAPLQALGTLGVAVVASAGNDATARPMFPAAFTPYPGGVVAKADSDMVPIVSVGALNPNRRTIALFSNGGPWVRCYRPGASIVSTLPVTFNASLQPGAAVDVLNEGPRATIDGDDFSGGFGTWSGTSFAAPHLAGQIAAALASGSCGTLDPVDAPAGVARGWAALGQLIGMSA
jgi:hypothetical protein